MDAEFFRCKNPFSDENLTKKTTQKVKKVLDRLFAAVDSIFVTFEPLQQITYLFYFSLLILPGFNSLSVVP